MQLIIVVMLYFLAPICIVLAYQKWSIVQKIGTVILAYAVGIVLSILRLPVFEPGSADETMMLSIQTWLMSVTVPLAIPLMLLSCDFRMWVQSLPKTLIALVTGLFSVVIAVIVGFFVFRDSSIDNFSTIAAMMIGIYTGGTMNFAALGTALHVDPTVMTCLLTIEMLITFPLIVFLVGGGYRLFRIILPFASSNEKKTADTDVAVMDVENYSGFFSPHSFPKTMIGVALSVAFLGIAAGLSLLILGELNEMIVILTVTSLAIGASFFEKIRILPKTFEVGMVLILIFSVVVASRFDFTMLQTSAVTLVLFVLFVLCVTLSLHIILCRIFRVEGDLFVVANVGLLCSPPFIPPVVAAMGNKKVLVSGLAIGLFGYAIGTYLGVLIAWFLG